MANDYTEFSTDMPLYSQEERQWFERHLDFEDALNDDAIKLMSKICDDEDADCYEFEYKFIEPKEPDDLLYIIFYAIENGDPYQAACLVHAFLKEMRKGQKNIFQLTWANYCLKSRPDAFAGGTVVATEHGVGWCGATCQYECAKQSIIDPFSKPPSQALSPQGVPKLY